MRGVQIVLVLVVLSTVVATFAAPSAFTDVPGGQPYSEAVAELAARGYINGYGDGTFGPDDRTLRAQMAALIAALQELWARCPVANGQYVRLAAE